MATPENWMVGRGERGRRRGREVQAVRGEEGDEGQMFDARADRLSLLGTF